SRRMDPRQHHEGGSMTARFIVGDVFDGLAGIKDGSVDLVVTSPPFLKVRSYLPADHPDKAKEIGHEATPAAFVDTLLRVTAELRRVLAPHGSIAIELGDTYAGSERDNTAGWPLAKSKTLIPELYRIALAYGINPLTGQESPAGKWRIRNVVTWCRPNPPVGALGDKWRPATSDIVIACVSDKRYWDDIATRGPLKAPEAKGIPRAGTKLDHDGGNRGTLGDYSAHMSHGAPLLDWWELPPGGYHGSHYAVYPPELVAPLVKAMLPPKVCRACGEPSRRIVETRYSDGAVRGFTSDTGTGPRGHQAIPTASRIDVTLGWSNCGHDDYRPPVTLDPFAGSGTTLAV